MMSGAAPENCITAWTRCDRPWLRDYQMAWIGRDAIAGLTLAAYSIPVSLAYANLAGLPPQVGIYGYLLGGLGYALLGSSRQLAVGPTSAISLMIAVSIGVMAAGDAQRYVEIASLTARHPENEELTGVIALQPEASLIYANADTIFTAVSSRMETMGRSNVRLVVCDLSASPFHRSGRITDTAQTCRQSSHTRYSAAHH